MQSDYYLRFENKFRGSRENIIKKLSIYDSLIKINLKKNSNQTFLDIGSGRGEILQRWQQEVQNFIGIEQDQCMVKLCKEFGLNVIHGEAISTLSEFKSGSVSLITVFHMIEHLSHKQLSQLLVECNRVLDQDGILVMETPSIENLLVSSKTFYLDPSHINPINPDGLLFLLQSSGFKQSKYYYINGAPLQQANPINLTRVLNGVAQDVCFVATKNQVTSHLLFEQNKSWENDLEQAPSMLDAAVQFDHERDKTYHKQIKTINSLNQTIKSLNYDLILLKNQLKYIILFLEIVKKILFPFLKIYRFIKNSIIKLCSKIFKIMVNNRYTRQILTSKTTLEIIQIIFKIIPIKISNPSLSKIHNKLNKTNEIDSVSMSINKKLLIYYKNSIKAKHFKNQLFK